MTTVQPPQAINMPNTAILWAATQPLNPPAHRARTEKDEDVTVTAETVVKERQGTMTRRPSTKARAKGMTHTHKHKRHSTTDRSRFVKALILMRHKAPPKFRLI